MSKSYLISLCAIASLRLCEASLWDCVESFVLHLLFAVSADRSLTPAATAQQLHSGGHTGAFRCTCVISAASAEPTAMQKCQFSGFSAASRLSFQRMYCKICNNRHK